MDVTERQFYGTVSNLEDTVEEYAQSVYPGLKGESMLVGAGGKYFPTRWAEADLVATGLRVKLTGTGKPIEWTQPLTAGVKPGSSHTAYFAAAIRESRRLNRVGQYNAPEIGAIINDHLRESGARTE